MKTGTQGKPSCEYQVRWTDRIYRLHKTGIANHAPQGAGVFEIVLFPPGASDGEVIFVGFEPQGGSVAERLRLAFEGFGGLNVAQLKELQEHLADAYFDAVSVSNATSDADLMDLAWAVAQEKKPRLNELSRQPHSGRFSEITVKEV
ncbi:MAG: hypothetical protein V4498_03620 [candidate division FCPU426 bacterium]